MKRLNLRLATGKTLNNVFAIFFPGKEFEILIDSHGPEHVTQLMQKVISVLEHLEQLSAEQEGENTLVDTLKTTITHLELEDHKRSEERHRHDKVTKQLRGWQSALAQG